MIFSITTFSMKGLYVTLSINDNQYKNTACLILFVIMQSVVILNGIMLSVIMLSVIILSVIGLFCDTSDLYNKHIITSYECNYVTLAFVRVAKYTPKVMLQIVTLETSFMIILCL
jgi:hypothetical protein